jgi:hypothetical protein
MWLAFLAAAAYLGFGAVMMFHEGGRPGTAAHAGVPLDAVLAVTEGATDRSAPAVAPAATPRPRPAGPAFSVGEVIPPGANTAEAVGLAIPADRSLGAAVERFNDAGVAGANDSAGGSRLQFIVKLADGETWRDRFLDDPAAARQAWAEHVRANPAFAGLRLERMSYGGEATLELEADAPSTPAAQMELARDIARRLSAAPGVEYAEPNLVGVRESVQ